MLRSFIDGAQAGHNVGGEACMVNLMGDPELMREVLEVKGFREVLETALPPSQRRMGWLAKTPRQGEHV